MGRKPNLNRMLEEIREEGRIEPFRSSMLTRSDIQALLRKRKRKQEKPARDSQS